VKTFEVSQRFQQKKPASLKPPAFAGRLGSRASRLVRDAPDWEAPMAGLSGKNVVVLGASRGVGRVIAGAVHAEGAQVLAAARNARALAALSEALPGLKTLAIDATDDNAPAQVFATLQPDVLVMCAGAKRTGAPLHELTWEEFAETWDTDVKASFLFCKAALRRPLPPGTAVILISSGAALGGSPISGGYAGAKRMQMFMANYAQKESDRLKLSLRFLALAPMRPMPDTEGGQAAAAGYAKYLGISAEEFIRRIESPQTAQDVAKAVVELAAQPNARQGNVFVVSGKGIEPVS
jgi:NAD(P)-dependent dehydrogenase (short-subunit alcohol dehydrogenase family)